MRYLAMPHLLHTVYLKCTDDQIISFCSFIIVNASKFNAESHPESFGPGKYIRNLELLNRTRGYCEYVTDSEYSERNPSAAWTQLLTQALGFMPNLLTFLSLAYDIDDFIKPSPQFAQALLSLPRLEILTLKGIGPETSKAIAGGIDMMGDSINLKLKQLILFGKQEWVSDILVVAGDGVKRLLYLSRVHLISLELAFFSFMNVDGGWANTAEVTFPNVVFAAIHGDGMPIKPMASAFPAVRFLDIQTDVSCLRHNIRPSSANILFPSLTSISGSYSEIYHILKHNLARSRVLRVVIGDDWSKDRVSAEAQPLRISMIAPHLKCIVFRQRFIRPLSWWKEFGSSLPNMIYMSVNLQIRSEAKWNLLCKDIPGALGAMQLRCLTVVAYKYDRKYCGTNSIYTEEDAFALSYGKSIPTLEYFEFKIPGFIRGTSWIKFIRKGDETLLQKLSLTWNEEVALRNSYDYQGTYDTEKS
ncbi:hypothetical protein JR316_0001283 [Psilocybe cubensis]|nr:hypothetical protein JR316_0001283 [Psilocybe cubensis]KAH9487214.1 hypothetical protein JR316_0001283 [Psilocybe cubensis]